MTHTLNQRFGRINEDGNVAVLDVQSGEAVTRIEDAPGLYPVGSDLGCRYEHPAGIIVTQSDAKRFGIEIERCPVR